MQRGVDASLDSQHHVAHQAYQGRKMQLACVTQHGGIVNQGSRPNPYFFADGHPRTAMPPSKAEDKAGQRESKLISRRSRPARHSEDRDRRGQRLALGGHSLDLLDDVMPLMTRPNAAKPSPSGFCSLAAEVQLRLVAL